MPTTYLTTIGLLAASNVLMTFARYVHPRSLANRRWWIAAVASLSIALFLVLRPKLGW